MDKLLSESELEELLKLIDEREKSDDGHTLRVEGYVIIENGRNGQVVRNKITNLLSALLITVLGIDWTSQSGYAFVPGFLGTTKILVGTDTSTPTTPETTALTSPIGSTPGTAPNTQSGSTYGSAGNYTISISGIWNAGTITGTVGEIGLYSNGLATAGSYSITLGILTRISVADGEFETIPIDTASPFSVVWVIQLTAP